MALRLHVLFTNQLIGEGLQRVQSIGVFCEVAMADLAVAEDLLN